MGGRPDLEGSQGTLVCRWDYWAKMRFFLRVLSWKLPHLLPCSQVLVVTTQLSFFSMRETFNLSDLSSLWGRNY